MMWGDNSGWGMWLGMGISTLILVVLIALLVWSISRIGRVSTPGLRMSISRKLMPSCFLVKSVRTRQKHQSAHWAPDVQIFWPLTRKLSPRSSALV